MFKFIRHLGRRPLQSFTAEELREDHKKRNGGKIETVHGMFTGEHIGDFVYGGIDGVVTTFAIVAGVAGANLSASIILVLGLANLFADGFAMAVGNFLSIRSEKERYNIVRLEEAYEIEKIPEYEREEVRTIYKEKGFEGKVLDEIVTTITSDKDRWLREMLFEEHGLTPDFKSPLWGGFVTYISFILIGSIPLLSFVAELFFPDIAPYAIISSVVLTGFALFFIGALKTLVVKRSIFKSGMETLGMGGLAAIVAYAIGYLLRGLA